MESTPEEAAEGLAIVRVLAAVLDRLVCANSALARNEPVQVTKFHALKAPGIGIQQYLERIHKYASCSSQCFILALIYIDRLIQRNNFLLTELNVHRVIVTAILLAAKFFDDAYYNNAYYAKVGGVLVSEMNGLEVDFLFRINFSLHVTPELFEQYRIELLSHSGTESLPLPPQLYMDTATQLVQQQQQQQQQAQCIQPQQSYAGFPIQAPVQHITPSPTRPPFDNVGLPFNNTGAAFKSAEDEVMEAIQNSNLGDLLSQEFNYLQRANSMPLQPKPLVNPQPQPLSAPAMMAMVPGHFPALVDVAAAAAVAANQQQYVVVDNQVYPLPSCNHQDHRLMGAAAAAASNHAALIHHVHHHPSQGFVSQEVSHRFAAGQMVAGVSGGM